MKRDIKRLGELLGKMTITQATEFGLTGEELGALLTAQQKIAGVYEDFIHNTERMMAGEGALPDEQQAAAVLGYVYMDMKIFAIKSVRAYAPCSLVHAKQLVEKTMEKRRNTAPKELIPWLVGELRMAAGK